LEILSKPFFCQPRPLRRVAMGGTLDRIYQVFLIITLFFAALFDVSHFPFWPNGWYLTFGRQFELWYIGKFKDPIYAGLPDPKGWADGMFFLEQLQIPFWIYLVFAKSLSHYNKG
jgi:hypothetical protein